MVASKNSRYSTTRFTIIFIVLSEYSIYEPRSETIIRATTIDSLILRLRQHFARLGQGNLSFELARALVCDEFPSECEPQIPSLLEAARNFIKAMKQWHSQGRPIVPDEVFEERKAVCLVCEHWRGWHSGEIGYCSRCKCGSGKLSLKLKMATEHCPLYKWTTFTVANTEPTA